jgi:SAM-dependent methyltransferase
MSALRPTAEEALADWAQRVRANREQAERVREETEGADFYAPVAQVFRADPRRTDEPALDRLLDLVRTGETWLDIGAGGGRYALPIALKAGEVIAVDPSAGMVEQLRAGMTDAGINNVRVVESRWPMDSAPRADVALMAHVGYDIEDIGPFLDAMEASAGRLCVAILLGSSPAAVAAGYFEQVHGEPRRLLPALPEFLSVLLARGKLFEVWLGERGGMHYHSREQALAFLRQQMFVRPGGEKDVRLQEIVAQLPDDGGRVSLSSASTPLGIVTWAPR